MTTQPGVWTLGPPSPPLSELTLARISRIAYSYGKTSLAPDVDGYQYESGILAGSTGFSAVVYRHRQNDQVVVAFRGTELGQDLYTAIHHICADVSWVNGTVNLALAAMVQQAAALLAKVGQDFNTSKITLTGNSLGGAIAQILSAKTGLPVESFDAPGPQAFMEQQWLKDALSPLNQVAFQNFGAKINLRLWGDPISRVGTPIPGTIVRTLSTTPVLEPLAGYWSSALDNHSIDNLTSQLEQNATLTYGLPDPIMEVIADVVGTTANNIKWAFTEPWELALSSIEPLVFYGIEPGPANEYVLTSQPGSPLFASLVLPTIPGINSFKISVFANNKWGEPITLGPLQKFNFNEPTSSFKFWPLDSTGKITAMPEHFVFDVAFSISGNFSGTIQGRPKKTALPFLLLLLID